MQSIQHRTGAGLAQGGALGRWAPGDVALDLVEGGDALDCFGRQRGRAGDVQVVEPAAHVCPARGLDDSASLVEPVEPGIAVSLERAPEPG